MRREILIFLFVGFTTVLIDFFVYIFLNKILLLSLNSAKAIGFISGTVFSFFANKLWTFNDKSQLGYSAPRYALLYTTTMSINVFLNFSIFTLTENVEIAFLVATAVSAFSNFVGMKKYVFLEK